MRLTRFTPFLLTFALLAPLSASALEGIGPRSSVTGTVQEVHVSAKQKFDEMGGELILKAENGQIVKITLQDKAIIISEGRLSRKQLLPVNIIPGMLLRIRGLKVGSDALTASLVVVMNIETNPILSTSGIIQSISGNTLTVLHQDGKVRTFTITNETNVNIAYELTGVNALSFVGKQALLTLNPSDSSVVRIVRITGDAPYIRTK